MSDREILQGIAENNREIIKTFYRDNLRYIRKYIIQNSGTKEDVEDVFQDAMIVLFQKLKSDSVILNAGLNTYFFGICKNIWMKRLRRKNKVLVHGGSFENEKQLSETIIDDMDQKERKNLYRNYFLRLSESCQELLTMVFKGKSMREIGELTGYTEQYARKKKFECKKNLLECIEKDPLYDELKFTDAKETVL